MKWPTHGAERHDKWAGGREQGSKRGTLFSGRWICFGTCEVSLSRAAQTLQCNDFDVHRVGCTYLIMLVKLSNMLQKVIDTNTQNIAKQVWFVSGFL